MKGLNPIFFFNTIIIFFVLLAIGLMIFIIKNSLGIYYGIALLLIALFLLFILYSLNKKKISISDKKSYSIDKYKRKLIYNDDKFIIKSYSYDLAIKWGDIEAIFLKNSPPLDGEYHNNEYRIILNKDPLRTRNFPQKWYDGLLPKPKKEKYPMIKIDDYSNLDFDTFYGSIEKYLNTEKKASDFQFEKFFGNETKIIKKNENTIVTIPARKPYKTLGFYKIFDRENPINDNRLLEYRNNAQNIK